MTKNIPFGFLLVDKPVGWTSFDVCGKTRKQLKIKRVGHTGTLDPFATGLLVVAVGKATKLIPFFEKDRKVYETEILLGQTSETLDTESEIVQVNSEQLTVDGKEIEKVLKEQFMGKIQQVPPKYSALKIGGKKMCDMARKGEEFEIKPRETEILSVEILEYAFPVVKIRLEVAAGFYVRSFARDLGKSLGCGGGLCQQLRRIRVGDLDIEKNETVIRDLEVVTTDDLISPLDILDLPKVEIEAGRIDDFLQGRAFPLEQVRTPQSTFPTVESGLHAKTSNVSTPLGGIKGWAEKFMVVSGDRFLGIGEEMCGNLQPRIGFQGEMLSP